jgi:hypothetical protein
MSIDSDKFNAALKTCIERYPYQSIGQIISNAMLTYSHVTQETKKLFYVTDRELWLALEAYAEY